MYAKFVALILGVLALTSASVQAEDSLPRHLRGLSGQELARRLDRLYSIRDSVEREASRVLCEPFSSGNGSWVLETTAPHENKCGFWTTTNLIRLADYEAGILCNYVGEECIKEQELDEDGLKVYARMRTFRQPGTERPCDPITDWKTYLIEKIPAAHGEGCSMSIGLGRTYDLALKKLTISDGKSKKVGSVTISRVDFFNALERVRKSQSVAARD